MEKVPCQATIADHKRDLLTLLANCALQQTILAKSWCSECYTLLYISSCPLLEAMDLGTGELEINVCQILGHLQSQY